MEKMIKRAGLALATIGLATSALAGSYEPPVCQCDVTIPKYDGGFRIAVEKLYTEKYVTGTTFAYTADAAGAAPTNAVNHNVDPDYDMGFRVEAAYLFPGTGNDVVVGYQHQSWNESQRVNATTTNFLTFLNGAAGAAGVVPGLGTFGLALTAGDDFVKGSIDEDDDIIDLEFGQAVNLGKRVTLRFHAGLRYASMDTSFQVRAYDDLSGAGAAAAATTGVGVNDIKFDSDFDGLGPRMGIDGMWHLGSGFDLVAELSTSMLVGDIDNKVSLNNRLLGGAVAVGAGQAAAPDTSSVKEDSEDCVVANIDARLGARYTYVFANNSELGLELGYQVSNYFDADGKFAPVTPFAAGNGGGDLGYHGVYFRADYTV